MDDQFEYLQSLSMYGLPKPKRDLKKTRLGMQLSLVPSKKNNRVIRCESSLEADLARIFEWDPRYVGYVEQPIEVDLGLEYKHPYVPDFLTVDLNASKRVWEVKPDHYIYCPRQVARYRAAKLVLAKEGLDYEVITESQIRAGILWKNLKLLAVRVLGKHADDYAGLVNRLRGISGPVPVKDLRVNFSENAISQYVYRHCVNIREQVYGPNYLVCAGVNL